MYYLLTTPIFDDEVWQALPEATDVELCTKLYYQREPFPDTILLTFRVGKACLGLDFLPLQNASRQLCSSRFLEVLLKVSVPFTTYPTQIIDKKTGRPFDTSYSFWIPQRLADTIDWERSQEWVNVETGTRHLLSLVLADRETPLPLLFQTREQGYFLVHETLRQQLEEANIKGIVFVSLEDISMPEAGLKRQELVNELSNNPHDTEKWCQLSDLYVSSHRYQQALAAVDSALAVDKTLVKAWTKRGHILSLQGRLQEAEEVLKHALVLDPHSPAWSEYSAVLRELGRNQEALTAAERAVQLHSQSPAAWIERIASYMALGEYEQALWASGQILTRKGINAPVLTTLYRMKGETLFLLDRFDEALATYTATGFMRSTRDRKSLAGKAKTLRALGRDEEAATVEQELRELEQHREKNLRKRPL